MSSTPYTGAASLGQVIPFPPHTVWRSGSHATSTQWFEAVAGGIERLLDFCAVIAAVCLAHWIAAALRGTASSHDARQPVLAAAAAFGALMVMLLERNGHYRTCLSLLAVRETERLLRATMFGILLAVPALVAVAKTVPRLEVAVAALLVPAFLGLEKWQAQILIRTIGRPAGSLRKAVIVGVSPLGRRIFSALGRSPKLGIDPVAFVEADGTIEEPVIFESWYRREHRAPVLAGPVTLRMLRRLEASVLILADPDMTSDESEQIRSEAEAGGISTYIIPGPFANDDRVTEYVELDGVMLARRVRRAEHLWYETAKRGVDVVLSVLSLALLTPLMAAAALAVKLTSPGPVIFRQKRVGRNGLHFDLYKFRTMYVDAPRYACSPTSGRDPRITPMGRFLRHTCIDELPQLINVLRGEMSLVGPRPEMPFIVAQYEAGHLQRLAVKPGITGLWQLSADRMSPIHHNISYDIYWIDDCVEGLMRLMASHYHAPLNLGTEELVTVDQLVDMTCRIAGKRLHKVHALEKPQGVRGRNSDNSRLRVVLGWEPKTPLAEGLEITYRWIEQELERAGRLTPELAYA